VAAAAEASLCSSALPVEMRPGPRHHEDPEAILARMPFTRQFPGLAPAGDTPFSPRHLELILSWQLPKEVRVVAAGGCPTVFIAQRGHYADLTCGQTPGCPQGRDAVRNSCTCIGDFHLHAHLPSASPTGE
jgi:hypothetical protein